MPSRYLDAAEYGVFGLSPSTTELPDVLAASMLVDAYLCRQEGLIHDGSVMEATGRPIVEERDVPASRILVLSRAPVATVVQLMIGSICAPFNYSELADGWELEQWDGRLFLPSTVGWPCRARTSYLAGYTRAELPSDVKLATALLVRTRAATGDLPAGIKRAKAGDAELEWGGGSRPIVDDETARLLAPYRRVIS